MSVSVSVNTKTLYDSDIRCAFRWKSADRENVYFFLIVHLFLDFHYFLVWFAFFLHIFIAFLVFQCDLYIFKLYFHNLAWRKMRFHIVMHNFFDDFRNTTFIYIYIYIYILSNATKQYLVEHLSLCCMMLCIFFFLALFISLQFDSYLFLAHSV